MTMFDPWGQPVPKFGREWYAVCRTIIEKGVPEAYNKYHYKNLIGLSRALELFAKANPAITGLKTYREAWGILLDESVQREAALERLYPKEYKVWSPLPPKMSFEEWLKTGDEMQEIWNRAREDEFS